MSPASRLVGHDDGTTPYADTIPNLPPVPSQTARHIGLRNGRVFVLSCRNGRILLFATPRQQSPGTSLLVVSIRIAPSITIRTLDEH